MASPNSSPEIDNGFKHDKERTDSSNSESNDPSVFQGGQDLSVWETGCFIDNNDTQELKHDKERTDSSTSESNDPSVLQGGQDLSEWETGWFIDDNDTQEPSSTQATEEPFTQDLFAQDLEFTEELNPKKKIKISPDIFEESQNEPGPSGEGKPQEPFSTEIPSTSTAMHQEYSQQMTYNTASETQDLDLFGLTDTAAVSQLTTFNSGSQREELLTPQEYYSQDLTYNQAKILQLKHFMSMMDGRILNIIHKEIADAGHNPDMAYSKHIYALISQAYLNHYCMDTFPDNAEARRQMKKKIEEEVEEILQK